MVRDNPIRDSGDANWYLGIAEDFTAVLPIDEVVDRLCEKCTIQKPVRQARQEARRATLEAYNSASSALSIERARQTDRHNQPKELAALAVRLNEMMQIYDDIVSSLGTKKGNVTRKHIEELLTSRYDGKERAIVLATFDSHWREFSKVGNTLRNAHRWLIIGEKVIRPRRGRPKEFVFYFVKQLSISWVKLTGDRPTRVYDAYSHKETGDFHAYCNAAVATVAGLHRIGPIDASVREVCKAWRDEGEPASIW